ncbi:hypothetical protein LRP49_02685 [Enterovibrio sp. ZSDZ35]|uniref:ParB-like nuclease domain-containing protein n=1 Tax=Enterovibrio qingdaonensis TaxID=2899818 RepID=A0ABT5QGJ9_9GAMM|nr:hypothetical protein [Enterovibrio sp. ZSDZ35]MDD1780096.1 hypothetical protein [Enterovibrio sp. ZSDZ35]
MQYMPVTKLVELDLHWVRGKDVRFTTLLKSLRKGDGIREAILLINCACGKTYILQDGGHRISAAYQLYLESGKDSLLPVSIFHSPIP